MLRVPTHNRAEKALCALHSMLGAEVCISCWVLRLDAVLLALRGLAQAVKAGRHSVFVTRRTVAAVQHACRLGLPVVLCCDTCCGCQ